MFGMVGTCGFIPIPQHISSPTHHPMQWVCGPSKWVNGWCGPVLDRDGRTTAHNCCHVVGQ